MKDALPMAELDNPPDRAPLISVVTCTHNRAEELAKVLDREWRGSEPMRPDDALDVPWKRSRLLMGNPIWALRCAGEEILPRT
jgi:hypothetical protein